MLSTSAVLCNTVCVCVCIVAHIISIVGIVMIVYFYFVGILEYMKEKFSHAPSMDMSKELLAMFSDLMRVCMYLCQN